MYDIYNVGSFLLSKSNRWCMKCGSTCTCSSFGRRIQGKKPIRHRDTILFDTYDLMLAPRGTIL